MSSYAMLGRPVDLGYQRIDTIDSIDDEIDELEFVGDLRSTWNVQVDAGDVRTISGEQVRDFLRLGVISARTYVWQQGMPQWLPLSTFLSEPLTPPASSVHSELPTQPLAASRPPPRAPSSATPRGASPGLAGAQRPTTARSGTYVQVAPSAANRAWSAPPPAAAVTRAEDDETWSVLFGPGDVRSLSLEQLDDFFRLGVIDEQTYVWQKGMSEWSKLNDILGPEEDEADIWYAMMAPGDVKPLTLEQLDDFYRLDIINERTPVWQEGMAQWLPLGMAAGIEAEPSVPIRAPAWGPSPSTQPTTEAARVARPQGNFPSAVPVALSIPIPESPRERKSWVLRLAIAAGLLLTLFRNDVVYSVAELASQKSEYTQAERRALGGPSFGTSRSVESLIAATGGRIAPVRLPWLVTETQANRLATETKVEAERAEQARVAEAARAKLAETKAAQPAPAPAVVPPKAANDGIIAAALTGVAPVKPKFNTVKPASMPKAAKKRSGKGQGGPFRSDGKGDYYDPLNAAM